MATKKGRRSKGPRDHLVSRPSLRLGQTVRASSEREGYESLSDYIAAVLAKHEGLPSEAPQPLPHLPMEVLDISA